MRNKLPSEAEKKQVKDASEQGQPLRVSLTWGTNSRVVVLNQEWNPEGISYEQMLQEPNACMTMQARHQQFVAEELSLSSDISSEFPERWLFSGEWHNVHDGLYFGGSISFHDGQVPDVEPFLGLDDVDDFLAKDFSDPENNPFIRTAIGCHEKMVEACRDFSYENRSGEVAPLLVNFDGPTTVAVIIFGADILMLPALDPDKFRELMLHITKAAIIRNKFLRRLAGLPEKVAWGNLADDSIQLLSSTMVEELVLPALELWYDEITLFPAAERKRVMHLCGDATRHFPMLAERLGISGFDTGFPVDHGNLRKELGPEVHIYGGPHIELLLNGSPEKCYENACAILNSGVMEGGRFTMRDGNNLPPCVPRENLQAVYDAVLDEGWY